MKIVFRDAGQMLFGQKSADGAPDLVDGVDEMVTREDHAAAGACGG